MFRNTDRSRPLGEFLRGMSGGSGSTHSLACFAASVAFSQRHETSHTPSLRRGNAQNPGGLFKRRERRFDDAWSAHPVSTLAAGIYEYKLFDAVGEAFELLKLAAGRASKRLSF